MTTPPMTPMNNVSLQLQQYRALKGSAAGRAVEKTDASILHRIENTDFFRQLMQKWKMGYLAAEAAVRAPKVTEDA